MEHLSSFFRRRRGGAQFIATLLICTFTLAPISSSLQVNRTMAIPAFETNPLMISTNGVTAAATTAIAGAQVSLVAKEWTFDMIAFMMINLILQEISRSIVSWINSGFQGSPSFVTNFESLLANVVDKVAGQYIWESGLGALCSPFRLDVQMALDIQYRRGRDQKIECSLTGVVNNVNNFVNSANPVNNWDGWYQVSLRPENNVYGSLLLAQQNLGITVSNAKGQKIKLLDFGKGFLSKQKCEKVEGIEKCSIVTPGSTIEAQLNQTLGSGQRRIEVADEINEIISALFAQLARQAFAGVGGLLGLTQSGYGEGSGTYYDRMAASSDMGGYQNSQNPIEAAILTEEKWLSLHEQRVDLIDDAEDYFDESCLAGTQFSSELSQMRSESLAEIRDADSVILDLEDMADELAQSAGSPSLSATMADIMNEYLEMQAAGELHTSIDIQLFSMTTLPDTKEAITTFKSSVVNACYVNPDLSGAGD